MVLNKWWERSGWHQWCHWKTVVVGQHWSVISKGMSYYGNKSYIWKMWSTITNPIFEKCDQRLVLKWAILLDHISKTHIKSAAKNMVYSLIPMKD
jgi:hypothetical protein